jgi:DNA polymerase-3 subunit alpha
MGFDSQEQYHRLIKKTGISFLSLRDNITNNDQVSLSAKKDEVFMPIGKTSPFMFVGHNLIKSEDFFSSKHGKIVLNICDTFSLNKNDVYITNTVKYLSNTTENIVAKEHIKEFFSTEIVLVKPEIIFILDDYTKKAFESTYHFEFDTIIEKEIKLKIKEIEVKYTIKFVNFESVVANDLKDTIHKVYLNWKFTHLHAHNSFSLKDGVGKPETRIKWADENGKPAIATSNHGNICDWIVMYNKAKASGIKPILGCEFYFNRRGKELEAALKADTTENIQQRKEIKKFNCHFTAFAKNLEGYYNMIRIHNDAWLNRYYRFPITAPETIETNKKGIICLSGCSGSEANRVIYDKYSLTSEKRKDEIESVLKSKLKLMRSLMRTKNIDKYADEDDLDDSDLKYFRSHEENTSLNEEEYTAFARTTIEEQDKEIIKNADKKAREIIDWWHGIFGDNFYIEIMVIDYDPQKVIDEELIKIAKEKNIPIVITNDAHYIEKKQAKVQQLQMLNDQDKTFKDLEDSEKEIAPAAEEVLKTEEEDFDEIKKEVDEEVEQKEEEVEVKKPTRKVWTIKSEEMYHKSVYELHDAWEKWYKSDIFTEEVFWEGIENTCKIVDSVENFTIDKSLKLPKMSDDSKAILAKAVIEGLKYRKVGKKDEYKERARYELTVINKKGFTDYFLMVQDMVTWAKKTYGPNSVGPGRGSACGSLVNWLLGVTEVDPLKHNLMFERFLDIDRNDPVDIDVDYMPNVRNEIVNHLIDRYGRDSVANICTFGIAKTRVAILDVARVCGIAPQETLGVTTKLPKDLDEEETLEELEKEYPELNKYFNKWTKETGFDMRYFVEQIRGTHRNISMHASGVLVSSNKLSENIALVRARKNITTGWQEGGDYHELSDIGYYKFDILGLSNLQLLEEARLLVLKRHGVDIDWNDIDLNDPLVYEKAVGRSDHYGVFQFESALGKKVLDNVKPTNFEELAAISAIIRPGPLQMGMDEEFARRKRGFTLDKDMRGVFIVDGKKIPNDNFDEESEIPWSVSDIPECIRDIMAPTLGILCYQEMYMLLANKIGGQSKAETNNFRRAISKKSKSSEEEAKRFKKIDAYHKLWIENATKPEFLGPPISEEIEIPIFTKGGDGEKDYKYVDGELQTTRKTIVRNPAEDLWKLIESFAAYGFNASHAISYTYISFREYWLKTYYDAEFNIAVLNNTPRGKEKKGESVIAGYVTEMMRKGYTVSPPDINYSEEMFSLKSDKEIFWGLGWLKGMSDNAIKAIVDRRIDLDPDNLDHQGKYRETRLIDTDATKEIDGLATFYKRVGSKILNKRALEALIWSGALDIFITDNSHFLKNTTKVVTPKNIADRFDIHEYVFKTLRKDKKYERKYRKTLKKLIELETEVNGISMIELKEFVLAREKVAENMGSKIDFLSDVENFGKYTCIGKIESVERKTTKTNKEYHRITLRDETAMVRSIFVWPWKCRNWEDTKVGMLICCKLDHEESGFTNLTNFNSIADERE